jgi:hypothetical protein
LTCTVRTGTVLDAFVDDAKKSYVYDDSELNLEKPYKIRKIVFKYFALIKMELAFGKVSLPIKTSLLISRHF